MTTPTSPPTSAVPAPSEGRGPSEDSLITSHTYCLNCGEDIELEGTTWVTTTSGDEGGTYDMCEQSWDFSTESFKGHRLPR